MMHPSIQVEHPSFEPSVNGPGSPAGKAAGIVVAKDVHKTYDSGRVSVKALCGVSLSVQRGEMVAIMGPSGCGKTTLLNCLSGLDQIDSGEVRIGGVSLSDLSDDQKTAYRAKRMGYVFQAFNLLPVLSAVENVELPMLVSGTGAREARRKAIDTLAMVGLADWVKHYPSELSGGQQQRVAVARALVAEPEIIWGDVPTGNLDSANTADVMELLRRMNRENGQTLVLVTHSDQVASMAHRVVHMSDGQIVREERNGK